MSGQGLVSGPFASAAHSGPQSQLPSFSMDVLQDFEEGLEVRILRLKLVRSCALGQTYFVIKSFRKAITILAAHLLRHRNWTSSQGCILPPNLPSSPPPGQRLFFSKPRILLGMSRFKIVAPAALHSNVSLSRGGGLWIHHFFPMCVKD